MIERVQYNGRLNKDDEVLPVGDYSDARNVTIIQPSKGGGGANSIKKIESVNTTFGTDLSGSLTNPAAIAQNTDSEGNIYVLLAGADNASIWKIEPDETSTELLVYNHNSCTVTEPDLEIIDDIIIWNYYGDGVPLSWLSTRTPVTNPASVSETDIFFIKAPPIYPPVVSQVFSPQSYRAIQDRQFQFATRYVWDTGDVSALSTISALYGGDDDTQSYLVSLDPSEPTLNYVEKVEHLVREGNTGPWKRFDTKDYGAADDTSEYSYSSASDATSDWSAGTVLEFREGNSLPFFVNDTTSGNTTDSFSRSLGTLAAGTYTLRVQAGFFTKDISTVMDVDFVLYDSGNTLDRGSVNFSSASQGLIKEAVITVPSSSTYDIRVDYSRTQTGAGDTLLYFQNVVLFVDNPSTLGFYGQTFETLPTVEVQKQFDAVPYEVGSLELIDNRVFFGNTVEIKEGNESSVSLDISASSTTYQSGSSYKYNVTDETNDPSWRSPSVDGFPNNSRYGWGLVYYDDFLRTRGLETKKGWKSPQFGVGVADVTITKDASIPSWAKYYQLARTKNLDKDYIYEGYASGVYFLVEQPIEVSSDSATIVEKKYNTTVTAVGGGSNTDERYERDDTVYETETTIDTNTIDRPTPEVTISDTDGNLVKFLPYRKNSVDYDLSTVGSVKYFVIDIEGMLKANHPYNFQEGDIITGQFLSPNTNEWIEVHNIVTMKIEYQQGNLLYCDPSSILEVVESKADANVIGQLVISEYPQADESNDLTEQLFFEIYSPRKSSDERYYAVGDVFPISELTGLTNGQSVTKEVSGDTTWLEKNIGIPKDSKWLYNPAFAILDASASISLTIGDGGSSGSYPTERFVLNTETTNYDNNSDFSMSDGVINVHKSGAYRVSFAVDFSVTNSGGTVFEDGVTYATCELRKDSDNLPVATAVFTSDGGSGDQTIETTTSFEAGSGESYYLAVIGRQNGGSGETENVTFTLDKLTIGHGDNLLGDLTFGLKRRSLSNTETKSVILKATSKSGEVTKWNTDIGKPYVFITKKTNVGLDRRVRWGGRKIISSNYSRLHSFNSTDRKDLDTAAGSITSLESSVDNANEGGVLLAICRNQTKSLYVGVRAIQSGDGSTQLIQSNDVIASERTLVGGFGCQHKNSIAKWRGKVCWWDENNKTVVRYTKAGLFPVSDYKMRSYFQGKSGDCIGFVDPFYGYYHISFAADAFSVAFDFDDRWVSRFEINPDCRGSHFDQYMFLISGQQIYRSLTNGSYNTFLGTAGNSPTIELVANYEMPVELTGLAIQSDNYTDFNNSNGVKTGILDVRIDNTSAGGQYTTMDDTYFEYEDGNIYSHVYRDENVDQYTGPPLIGSKNTIKLTLSDATVQDNIRQVYLGIEKSYGHIM